MKAILQHTKNRERVPWTVSLPGPSLKWLPASKDVTMGAFGTVVPPEGGTTPPRRYNPPSRGGCPPLARKGLLRFGFGLLEKIMTYEQIAL